MKNTLNNLNNNGTWYERSWFIVLTLIIINPLGLALKWGLKKWNFWVRVVITSLCLIFFFTHLISDNEPKTVYKTNPVDKELKEQLKDVKSENKKLKKKIDELNEKIAKDKKETKTNKNDEKSQEIDSSKTSNKNEQNKDNIVAGASTEENKDSTNEKEKNVSSEQSNTIEAPQQTESQPEVQSNNTAPQTQHFGNCSSLRQVYPNGVPAGHPAYNGNLDRDHDGFACERD
ncbi:excalibur calcium-binding domain-containing protein [Mammaliicoccus sciuri]|uniref:excalibur calcium-binding domain-containing protein n=1 Tax=Mammaliicoccus sciuri TaxID=1296 RepID=UPI002DBB6647|nr:excalibur calcium-binding domain-containing protein [Mammaliicoccus sciuri]